MMYTNQANIEHH